MRHLTYAVLLISGACFAQAPPPPVAAPQQVASFEQMKYLRFILLNVASLDHSPDAIQAFEDHLVLLHGLNAQESLAIQSAGQALKPLLAQLRQAGLAAVAGKQVLSPAGIATLQALNAQREQKIVDLAAQLLSSVRPETAARLKMPGKIMASQGVN
jgi:hypothetical protein